MHPADSPRARRRYKVAFCSCAVSMVGLVIWQGARNAKGQSLLQSRVSDLQSTLSHTHIRFNIGAIAISTDDPTRFKVPATMAQVFSLNGKAQFNVDFQNVGASNSEHTSVIGDVIVVDAKPDLDKIFSTLETGFKDGIAGDELVPQDHKFFTANSRNLSMQDIDRLDHGKMGLYLVAVVRFSDQTGDYQQESCGWLQLPMTSHQLVWHGCGSHESERQLRSRGR